MTGNLSLPDRAPPVPRPAEQPLPRDRPAGAGRSSSSYGLTYTTGSLPRQVASAWKKVIRLSLPNGFLGRRAKASVTDLAASKPAREHLAA